MPPRVRRMLTPEIVSEIWKSYCVTWRAQPPFWMRRGALLNEAQNIGRPPTSVAGGEARAGKLAGERGIVRADDGRARGIVERVDGALRRLVGIAEGARPAPFPRRSSIRRPPSPRACRDAIAFPCGALRKLPLDSSCECQVSQCQASAARCPRTVVSPGRAGGLLDGIAHGHERAWPPKSTVPSDVHIVQ